MPRPARCYLVNARGTHITSIYSTQLIKDGLEEMWDLTGGFTLLALAIRNLWEVLLFCWGVERDPMDEEAVQMATNVAPTSSPSSHSSSSFETYFSWVTKAFLGVLSMNFLFLAKVLDLLWISCPPFLSFSKRSNLEQSESYHHNCSTT